MGAPNPVCISQVMFPISRSILLQIANLLDRPIMLDHIAFQLSRPPLNPDGLPQWALRPRGLDVGLIAYLSLGTDKNWQYVVHEMINRATSGETATEDGLIKPHSYDQSIQDEEHLSPEVDLNGDHYGAVGNYDAGDESENQDQFAECEDGGEESEEDELSKESETDDGDEYQGDESEEGYFESAKRKKSWASNPHSSKILPSTEGKTLAGKTIGDPMYFLFSRISGVCRYIS